MLQESFVTDESSVVLTRPNETKTAKENLSLINQGSNGSIIIRKVFMEVFGRNTLAFGSLMGNPSLIRSVESSGHYRCHGRMHGDDRKGIQRRHHH